MINELILNVKGGMITGGCMVLNYLWFYLYSIKKQPSS